MPLVRDGTTDVDVTLAILQGKFFTAPRTVQSAGNLGTWNTVNGDDLLATDFAAVDGSGDLPDFGRPFQFGYAFGSEYSTTALDVSLAVDNMSVEITLVPEPSSFVLILALGACAAWSRCVA